MYSFNPFFIFFNHYKQKIKHKKYSVFKFFIRDSKSERELFRLIKEKRVQEIILNPLTEKNWDILNFRMIDDHGELIIERIKKVKYQLGTKKYCDGRAILKGKKIFVFSSDPNSVINGE